MSEIISVLPDMQRKVLLALVMFRFLTPEQMVRLDISHSVESLRNNALKPLKRRYRALAKAKKIGQFLPEVHYLTSYGAKELAKQYRQPVENFPYPTGQVQFGPLFARHRFAQVDFHIGLRQWAQSWGDIDVLFADMDFDIIGSRRHGTFEPKTRLNLKDWQTPIVADGIFGIEFQSDHRQIVYILEVHRTTETKRVAQQIAHYIEIIKAREIMYKYRVNVSPAICSVHHKANVLRGVKRHLLDTPDFVPFHGAFIFNTAEQLAEDFTAGWHFADDTPAHPFEACTTPNTEPLIS